jgi:N-methylhydantoinase A
MKQSSFRMGVDIGGTFTDVVLEIGQQQFSTKVLTTYTAPEDAIIDCCGQLKLATSLEVNPSFSSAIIGDSPPLLLCGR